jgi:hypothetical protein
MRKSMVVLLCVAAFAGLTAAVAVAASPHFIKSATSVSRSGNSLVADFKISGLGLTVTQVDVSLQADAQCVNPGSKKPQASNKGTFSADGTFTVNNGTAEGELTLTPTFQPDCTPPMSVQFSNVHLVASVSGVVVATAAISGTF